MKDSGKEGLDEFEFKPLTEGLGFHDKEKDYDELSDSFRGVESVGENLTQNGNPSFTLSNRDFVTEVSTSQPRAAVSSLPGFQSQKYKSHRMSTAEHLRSPLSENKEQEDSSRDQHGEKYEEPHLSMDLKGVQIRGEEEEQKKERIYLEEAVPHIGAMFFDFFAILAMVCGCFFILLTVTGVELYSVIQSAQVDLGTRVSLFLLVISISLFYTTVLRSVLNSTLGEWTFDLQLGSGKEFESALYPLRSLWRQFVLIATGGVFISLCSWILRRDVAYWLTGLRLYKKHVKWES